MFDSLSDRLNDTFDRLRGKGKLTEADITSAMRDIRMALLEADVNFKVVKEFVAKTKERCMTAEVMESLSPAQNVVKIVLDEADKRGSDLVLIDTAGRLHTSPELMRELAKVVNVTRKRAANMAAGPMPVSVVLVIDAATGQNGLNQALEFNEALGLDGIIMTKLDGTAKGGIAMAVAEKLKLPILRIGVGEQVDDLQEFNAKDFCRALVGESN